MKFIKAAILTLATLAAVVFLIFLGLLLLSS